MKQTVADICNTILKNGYKIVLISGNGCAGKSTFAELLKNEFQKFGKSTPIISTDDLRMDMRYEQFELFVLPLADKFDLRLTSQNDFSYNLK